MWSKNSAAPFVCLSHDKKQCHIPGSAAGAESVCLQLCERAARQASRREVVGWTLAKETLQ